MAKRQPSDPFNGMGDWIPAPAKPARKTTIARSPSREAGCNAMRDERVITAPKSRKSKQFLARAEALAIFSDIQKSAEAALARLSLATNLTMARNDFEWIRQLAEDGRRAG